MSETHLRTQFTFALPVDCVKNDEYICAQMCIKAPFTTEMQAGESAVVGIVT